MVSTTRSAATSVKTVAARDPRVPVPALLWVRRRTPQIGARRMWICHRRTDAEPHAATALPVGA